MSTIARPNRTRPILLIGLCILIASCTPTPPARTPVPSPSPTRSAPPTPPTATSTVTPRPVSRNTPTPVPCDPLHADFCISDGHFILQRPILPPGNDSVERTYPFESTAEGTREPHHGVEFENKTGTPVHAAADGEVIFAGPDSKEAIYSPWRGVYGNLIVIRHTQDLFTIYGHLSVVDVEVGQKVKVGEKIGEVGRTGAAIGSHLHFEVRRGDVEDYFSAVNPELWLVPKTDRGVLAIAVMDAQGKYRQASLTIQSDSATYFVVTYDAEFKPTDENAALGDLPSGRYRIALVYNGQHYERWVDVESGKLTEVVIVVQ